MNNYILKCGDCKELIKDLQYEFIDLLVTSPPYWAKRKYNCENELGLEKTPEEYINVLSEYFAEMQPYVKKSGNIFINLGDTFFGSNSGASSKNINNILYNEFERYRPAARLQPRLKQDNKLYQNKQMLLIPSRFAMTMQEKGWILRDSIIWHKPNKIPTGVKDRFNNTYEYIFHFVLSQKYYFDLEAVKVPTKKNGLKNPGDVWAINTQAQKTIHTATFPEKLVDMIIKCASPLNGVVCDPFMGVGTTGIVCKRNNRNFIGYEINGDFFEIAVKRLKE